MLAARTKREVRRPHEMAHLAGLFVGHQLETGVFPHQLRKIGVGVIRCDAGADHKVAELLLLLFAGFFQLELQLLHASHAPRKLSGCPGKPKRQSGAGTESWRKSGMVSYQVHART